ncbi:uncharacterized protein LOC132285132 [Cornus florida]|uniref:uncharacterized protein LOC132285132 n=1 Tax=Cornus florida TaxID=4283 RepID=UPI0028A1F51C|nr:uncharacterized protein LOC132285132 [Cornus florida]
MAHKIQTHSTFAVSQISPLFLKFHLSSFSQACEFRNLSLSHTHRKMPIEMPKGVPFSVDTWSPSSKKKRHHFLTHAHKDHSQGISTHSSYPIYCTLLTKSLTLQQYPKLDDSLFVCIEVGQPVSIDDPDGVFFVTAFDANHCPGAVMFLFEGDFGNILHTGDCRLTSECLQSLPEKYIGKKGRELPCRLDYVFLDCTFGRFSLKMPSKHSAVRQVINCIWKHPDASVVYLTCDLLGQEEILVNVFQTFGSKIFVDKDKNPECFDALTLTVPDILSQDPSSRFQLFEGFPRLGERAKAKLTEARANLLPEPLIIRPSAQWYVCDEELSENEKQRKEQANEAVRDEFGIWHVCYSMHSSREELEWALQLLAPKWVVSTTPNCRAMELGYVKKHCFGSQLASKCSLSKLLDISLEDSLNSGVSFPLVMEGPTQTTAESLLQPVKISTNQRPVLILSPPRKRQTVTLFGRARLGLSYYTSDEENKIAPIQDEPPPVVLNKVERGLSIQDEPSHEVFNKVEQGFSFHTEEAVEVKCKKSLENKADVTEVQCKRSVEKDIEAHKTASYPTIGSSKRFNESFRKLYRSMNVPVPQPLPSLVDLMNSNKRAKRRFQF